MPQQKIEMSGVMKAATSAADRTHTWSAAKQSYGLRASSSYSLHRSHSHSYEDAELEDSKESSSDPDKLIEC